MSLFLAGDGFPASDPAAGGIDAAWDEFIQSASGTGRKRGGRRRRRLTRGPQPTGQTTGTAGGTTPASNIEQGDRQSTETVAEQDVPPPANDRILVIYTDEASARQAAEAIGARNPQLEVITAPVTTGELALPDSPDLLGGVVLTPACATTLLTALAPHRQILSTLVRRGTPLLALGSSAAVIGASIPGPEGEPVEALRLVGVGVSVEPVLNHTIDAMTRSKLRTTVIIDPGTVLRVDAVTGRTKVLGAGRTTWVGHGEDHFIIHHEPTSAPTGEID